VIEHYGTPPGIVSCIEEACHVPQNLLLVRFTHAAGWIDLCLTTCRSRSRSRYHHHGNHHDGHDRRGRQLSAEDIAHYQEIVTALGETIRLMGEVDTAIESAGGWPMK